MDKTKNIRLVKYKELDLPKWDHCIESAPNRRVYAFSWYLDGVAENWDAIVMGDYEYVMPLPYKMKLGIKYIYQPFYCQQLGIFPMPGADVQKQFIDIFKRNTRYANYNFNSYSDPALLSTFSVKEKVNQVISLLPGYRFLLQEFSKHTKRNLKVAIAEKVEVIKGLRAQDYLDIKKQHLKGGDSQVGLEALNRLMKNTISTGQGVIYAAYSSVNNLCAAAFFLADGNRVYYLNAFSTEEGRQNRAMYAIVEAFLKEHAGSGRILDFEGSTIEGVARFYRGFGALEEKYYYIHYNNLPLPFCWFKR